MLEALEGKLLVRKKKFRLLVLRIFVLRFLSITFPSCMFVYAKCDKRTQVINIFNRIMIRHSNVCSHLNICLLTEHSVEDPEKL